MVAASDYKSSRINVYKTQLYTFRRRLTKKFTTHFDERAPTFQKTTTAFLQRFQALRQITVTTITVTTITVVVTTIITTTTVVFGRTYVTCWTNSITGESDDRIRGCIPNVDFVDFLDGWWCGNHSF